jgi:hypothetical protein
MNWPPEIGELLPRAELAWCERSKLENWVLGVEGHGREWARVFGVRAEDSASVWEAIFEAAVGAVVHAVRDRDPFGVTCGVKASITIGIRSAPAILSWHYSDPDAAPRLVTAYLTL